MAEDASLDDFLDAGSEADEQGGDEREADERGGDKRGGEERDTAPAVTDPGRSTFAWSPGGAECAACGSVVERRWRDDDGLVCEDCKEW